jgi:Tetratricopeptide repeat
VDHPDTIRASANLAVNYHSLEQYSEAEALERDVLTRRTAILGNLHPDTLYAMHSLAGTCNKAGRHSEAVELARNATQMLLETQGETHPFYVAASTLLADLVQPTFTDRILTLLGKVFT